MNTPCTVAAIIILAMQPLQSKHSSGGTQNDVAASSKQTQKANDDADKRSPAVTVAINNALPAPNSDTAKQESTDDTDIQRRLVRYTLWLVIVGILTAAFIWWQAFETRRSVRAIRDSLPHQQTAAEAAKTSADAADKSAIVLVNSQRAWIMADIAFQLGAGIAHLTNPGAEHTVASVELRLRNCGPTPAWVFEQWIRLELAPTILMSDTPYQSPGFPGGFPGDRIEGAIGMGQSTVSYEILPIAKDDPPHLWRADISGNGWATEDNGLHTYIYGVVKYRDAFNSLCETYFGYAVKGRTLQRIPSDAFNKHT